MKWMIKKQWPLFGLCILLAVVAFYLITSDKAVIKQTLFENIIPGEGLILKDIQYAHENPDKGLTWSLDAEEMKSSGDKNSIYFREFRLEVKSKGRQAFKLKGEKGNYSRNSGEITLQENLEAISADGYKMLTDRILINEKNGHLSTERPVKISGPFFSIEGRGLFIDLEKESLKILSNVVAVLNTEHFAR